MKKSNLILRRFLKKSSRPLRSSRFNYSANKYATSSFAVASSASVCVRS